MSGVPGGEFELLPKDRKRWTWWTLAVFSGLALLGGGGYTLRGWWAKKPDPPVTAGPFALLSAGRLTDAEVALLGRLESHPADDAARDELRWLYFNQLRTRELERFLETQFERNPQRFDLLADILTAEFRKQLPREGLGYLRETDQRQPGQPPVRMAIGYCLWQIGELDEAQRAIESALKLRPDHLETRLIAAEFLIEQNELAAAARLLDEIPNTAAGAALRREFDRDDRAWFLRSLLAERRGDPTAALSAIEKALALRPGELRYVHRQGQLLQRLGRKQQAADVLQQANRLEAALSELSELVLRGSLDQPTPDLCRRLAELSRLRGRTLQAAGWTRAAKGV